MQKYKIVASKSQKKYTLVLSADSETEAKEKLHKEGYSILSVVLYDEEKAIQGKKFLFQIQKQWEVKNWVIVGKDIFKVYMKLRDELGYDVLFIYPEGDDAHTNAQKKQDIINELKNWYELQKKAIKVTKEKKQAEDNFYMKKKLDDTYKLIEAAAHKFDTIFNNRKDYDIDDETFLKLEKVYEKLLHIKGSTNIVKLKQVWELALVKIGEIELQSLEKSKNKESRDLLKQTNSLLKKIGSSNQFIEEDKDIKKKVIGLARDLVSSLSLDKIKEDFKSRKEKKKLIDKDSYSFLKTILLLDKYKEKLRDNTKEIISHIIVFINPFSQSDIKEKLILKRKVIKQNISILKAKKSGSLWSYTGIKKWYHRFIESFFELLHFLAGVVLFLLVIYVLIFLLALTGIKAWFYSLYINSHSIVLLLLFIIGFYILSASRKVVVFCMNLVFFSFILIFFSINF